MNKVQQFFLYQILIIFFTFLFSLIVASIGLIEFWTSFLLLFIGLQLAFLNFILFTKKI